MQTHLKKWGNSLGIRIPMQFIKQLDLHDGSSVTLELHEGRITIKPPKYNLESMLKEITPKNLHKPIFDDKQHGNEEW